MPTNANAQNETLLPRDAVAQQPRVGDVVRVTFQAPTSDTSTIGLTRIDARGIYGVMVRNTVPEIYPW